MGLFKLNTCWPNESVEGMKTLRFSSIVTALISCKLLCCELKLEEIINNKLGVEGIEPVSESLGDLDEGECVTLSADDGPCVDDVEKHVGVIDSTDMSGPEKLTIRSALGKPPVYHLNTLKAATFAGVTTTPNIFRGELSPWVLTTTHNDNTPLSIEPIPTTKMNFFGNLGLVETYDVGMNPLRPTLNQGVGYYIGLTSNSNSLEEATHWDDSHDWGGLNEEATLRTCLLSAKLMCDTIEELKCHNFTPHFHHYMLLELLICLTGLGSMVYTQKQTMGMAVVLSSRLRVYQLGYNQRVEHGIEAAELVRNKGELKVEVTNKKGIEIEVHGKIGYGIWIDGSRVEANPFLRGRGCNGMISGLIETHEGTLINPKEPSHKSHKRKQDENKAIKESIVALQKYPTTLKCSLFKASYPGFYLTISNEPYMDGKLRKLATQRAWNHPHIFPGAPVTAFARLLCRIPCAECSAGPDSKEMCITPKP